MGGIPLGAAGISLGYKERELDRSQPQIVMALHIGVMPNGAFPIIIRVDQKAFQFSKMVEVFVALGSYTNLTIVFLIH